MNVLDLAKGRTVKVRTNIKDVFAELTVEKIVEERKSRDLEPSTAANDWWPAQETWSEWKVTFTNGHVETYHSLSSIEFI